LTVKIQWLTSIISFADIAVLNKLINPDKFRLERLQNQAMRIILSANRKTCTQEMRTKLGLLSLNSRRRFLRLQLVYKIIYNIDCPQQLIGYFTRRSETHNRSLRDTTLLCVIPTKSKMGESYFNVRPRKNGTPCQNTYET
jgi:hypothetical protein